MANLRDIKRRIRSVSSTKQITHTMEMVSTTKIMRALTRAMEAAPYKNAMTSMLANVSAASTGENVPLLYDPEKIETALVIVVASDRGLAGGFNVQVERAAAKRVTEFERQGIKTEVITAGKKPTEFFLARKRKPILSFEGISADPTLVEANQISSYLMDAFTSHHLDRVEMFYQHAKSRVEQTLTHEVLLPVAPKNLRLPNDPRSKEASSSVHDQSSADANQVLDFEFEPSAREVLGFLIPAYIRTVIYHALIDSAAAEHGARRRAMQAATENATEIIQTLSRQYNRIRQSSITTELNEIVGGAAALEEM